MPTYEYTDWIQDPDYVSDPGDSGMGTNISKEFRYLRNEVEAPPDGEAPPLLENEDYAAAIAANATGTRYDSSQSGTLDIPDYGSSGIPFSAFGTRHFALFPGEFHGRRYTSQSYIRTHAFTANRVNERPTPVSPPPEGTVGVEWEDDALRSVVISAYLTGFGLVNLAWENSTWETTPGGYGSVIANGEWDTVFTAQTGGTFTITGEADDFQVVTLDWNDNPDPSAFPVVGSVPGGHDPVSQALPEWDLTEHLFGSETDGFVLLHNWVNVEDAPKPIMPNPDVGTGLVFGGVIDIAPGASVAGIVYTLRPPRYRYQIEIPDVEVLDVVRQYPRDDGRGLSAASRKVPLPKAKRVVGGYQ